MCIEQSNTSSRALHGVLTLFLNWSLWHVSSHSANSIAEVNDLKVSSLKQERPILSANHQQQIKLRLQIMKAWQKHVFFSLDPFIMFPGIKTKTCLLPALSLFIEELEFSPEFWEVDFAVKSHRGLCRPLLAHWKGQEERSCINPCGSEWCASKLELRSTCWGSPVNNPVKQNKTRAGVTLLKEM